MKKTNWLILTMAAAMLGCGADSGGDGTAGASAGGSAGAETGGSGGATGGAAGDTGGSAGQASSTDAEARAACEAFWTLNCARYEECASVAFFMQLADQAQCVALMTDICVSDVFGAPGSLTTPAQVEACTAALEQETDCQAWLSAYSYGESLPEACAIVPGEREDGASCVSSYQCASGSCYLGGGTGCGVCATPAGLDGDCTATYCQGGLACMSGKCKKLGALGDACSYTAPCLSSLACLGGTCQAKSDIGEACTWTGQNDACRPTGWCNNNTDVCEPYGTSAVAGGACGILDSGSIEYCAYGYVCRIEDKQAFAGMCEARGGSGDACEQLYAIGDSCLAPLVCVNGTCQQPSSPSCE